MPVLEVPAPTRIDETEFEERFQEPDQDEWPDDGIRESLERLSKLELPAEDGIPLESNWHRLEMNLLIETIHYHWRDRNDYFAGGNMFIYFNLQQARNRDYRGPDVFVVKDVDGTHDRDAWVLWEEDGRYPDVIVELASRSTLDVDLGFKKHLYEKTFRTQEYFCYDPHSHTLYGWKLLGREYVELEPNEQGQLWSEEMNLLIGGWQGEFQRWNTLWLRWYTPEGHLVPTLAEAEAQRADEAEAEVERLRALLQQYEGAKQSA